MANFFKGFFLDFYPSTKAGIATLPRIDETPYYLTWPLTFFLNKLNVQPTRIVFLSIIFGLVFLTFFVSGSYPSEPIYLCMLLLIRILLDYADGQLARYSQKTSVLGALYDLTSDFIFTVLLFTCIAFYLIHYDSVISWQAITICIIGLLANLLTATLASFTARLNQAKNQSQEHITKNFICYFSTDNPSDSTYTNKVNFLNTIFKYSWRLISIILFALLIRNTHFKNVKMAGHLFSIFANSMHLFLLIYFLLFNYSLWYFCLLEVFLLFLSYLFIIFFKLFSTGSAN